MPGTSKYLRGAFVQYADTFPVPTPKIITFQFNPETMTHSWQPAKTETGAPGQPADPLAITGSPEETFSFTLAMDANDMIEAGGAGEQLAAASGVYSRLAALEMLLFPTAPTGVELVGTVSVNAGPGINISLSAGLSIRPSHPVSAALLPMVLFVWGPGRIVPVRVAQLSITEKLYDSNLLNPTHAEAQIQLKVLTPEELRFVDGPLGAIGRAAQVKSDNLRRNRAGDNHANAVESVIGMLPL